MYRKHEFCHLVVINFLHVFCSIVCLGHSLVQLPRNFFLQQAYGMSAMPMSLIKGTKSAKKERMDVQNRRSRIADRSRSIREKVTMGKK